MAAKNLTLGVVATDTFPATAGQAREVVCPTGARWLYAQGTGEIAISDTGTDGSAPTAVVVFSSAGAAFGIRIPGSGRGGNKLRAAKSVFLTSSTNSDTVKIWAVPEGD